MTNLAWLLRWTKATSRDVIKTGIFVCVAGVFAQGQSSKAGAQPDGSEVKQQVVELRALVEKLQAHVDELEKHSEAQGATIAKASAPPASEQPAPPSSKAVLPKQSQNKPLQNPPSPAATASDLLHGTTINLLFDGYYGYNFNHPIGRVSLLRAYDVSSNAFSLNQAALVLENAADPANGKRFGLRLDLQYGQATETLQGNPANEPRPEIYRNIFQAYGTYVFPAGKGLTVDFGKFASSLGLEGNYTKDQMNYSRS